MQLLVSEDDYIAEAVVEVAKEMENLEEGYVSRGIRRLGHHLDIKKDKIKMGYHAVGSAANLLMGKKEASEKHRQKFKDIYRKMVDKRSAYLQKQKDDAEKSGHDRAANRYSGKLVKYENLAAHKARSANKSNSAKTIYIN